MQAEVELPDASGARNFRIQIRLLAGTNAASPAYFAVIYACQWVETPAVLG
jgi:hypothetical protein